MAKSETEGGGEIGAFFDIDGTVAASNLVDIYIDFRLRGARALKRGLWLLRLVPKLPYYALVDTLSRGRFNQIFVRNYKGVPVEELYSWAQAWAKEFWGSRLYPAALQEIRFHQQQGHRVALVTGGLKPMAQPLVDLVKADGCVAAEPQSQGGRLTGQLSAGPLSGAAKAVATRRLAEAWGVDLHRSYAYADSYADREFMEGLGHPVAVNPDRRLRRIARVRGWEIRRWRNSGVGVLSRVGRALRRR